MFKQIHFSSIDSTHKWALGNLSTLSQEHTLISADYQIAGAGRKGDPWISPPNMSLLLTFVFPLSSSLSFQNLAQVLSFSTMKTLEKLHFTPLFKWPNDLILSNKKVAGVMVDIHSSMAIASIGINVNTPSHLLAGVGQSATSLFIEKNHQDIDAIKLSLLNQFQNDLAIFQQEGFAPFFPFLLSRMAYLGKTASIENKIGRVAGLHPDGRLVLDIAGIPHLFATGSLCLMRRARDVG